jgi:hypothetical protein
MPVLPDVVGGRPREPQSPGMPPRSRGSSGWPRRLLAAGAAAAAVTALSGCAQFDAALGQRQAIVTFRDGTTLTERLAVRAACAKTPAVTPQPLPTNLKSPYALEQVTYQINHASNADVALLEQCLAKFPSVVGVTLQDSSDEGS